VKKIILLLLVSCALQANAQTKLKVTGIYSPREDLYNQWSKKFLGKPLFITIYDNSAVLNVGQIEENFKMTSANSYSKVLDRTPKELLTGYVKLSTTFSVITSLTYRLVIKEIGGGYRETYVELTAKRF